MLRSPLVRDILLFVVDCIAPLFHFSRQPSRGKKNLLVVRLDAIGDFILWLDAAGELRRLFPTQEYRITLVANALWSELAASLPWFDEVIPVERARLHTDLRYRWRLWKALRRTHWDCVIQPTYSREFFFGDAVVRVCGSPIRIGYNGDLSNISVRKKRLADLWYTRLIPACNQPRMELQRNADFIRGINGTRFTARVPEIPHEVAVLPKGFTAGSYIVVVPGAGNSLRQWPIHRFAELINLLTANFEEHIVICGATAENSMGRWLKKVSVVNLDDWTGRTSLRELLAVIGGARLVIGNESSAIHIAAAMGVKSVAIVGGGHFGRFLPYPLERPSNKPLPVLLFHHSECFNCNWQCVHKIAEGSCFPCINNIETDKAWNAVHSLLTSSNSQQKK